jgi:hypothetical protein
MNGDRYVSSFDETRSSLLSSSVVKVHHSFGRAHENRSCVCRNEGFRLDDLRDGRAPGESGAGTAHVSASVTVP